MALGRWRETIWQDLRYGARQLRLNPGFGAVAVLSLALGIGANTAIFQLVDAVRLRTLPVRAPQELVSIEFQPGAMRSGWSSTRSPSLTYPLWDEIRKRQQAFVGMVAWSAAQFNLAVGGEARYAQGLYVSGGFFQVLGVPSILGRTFTEGDDQPACASPGAVISHSFWQREFAADPAVVGRAVRLDGRVFPIIGVTPARFFGVAVGSRYDVAIPLCADSLLAPMDIMRRIPRRDAWWLALMGRLKPGLTAQQAQAEFRALSPTIMQATLPPSYRPDGAKRYLANKLAVAAGATGISELRRQYETPLWLLLATAGLVLLIACANLANLLLARASVREREIAVRQAIGAPRSRLIIQLLAESLLLAGLGTAIGAACAQIVSRALIAFLSTPNDPVFVGIALDGRVLAFTAGIAVSTCLLFGLLPALRATQVPPAAAMRSGGRGSSAGRERFALRRMLVATQVALSMVLLVGALLFVHSLRNLVTLDPGFRPEGIVAVSFNLDEEHYSQEKAGAVTRNLLERIRATPGVMSAAQVNIWPISGSGWNGPVYSESDATHHQSFFTQVGPGYFRTMRTPLLAGRDFDGRDTAGAPKVAVVNQAFARMVFGGANPVGRSFRMEASAGQADPAYQIVGLARNAKYRDLREEYLPIAYLAAGQEMNQAGSIADIVMRTNAPLRATMDSVKSVVAQISPEIGIEFHVLTQRIEETLLRDRLMAALSGAFGLLAGLLSTLGLYGVIAYMVARRRNEIGVRMALGADRGRVVGLILREACWLLLLGLAIGTGLALWLGRAATALLYGLKPYDPAALAGALGVLVAVGILASIGPALRAAQLHPMDALREE
jgi:putative ABC transport system permease protein